MPAYNPVHYDRYNNTWHCKDCNRDFQHRFAIDQHLRSSAYHSYCVKCELEFPSMSARRQHYIDSRNHAFCPICEEDYGEPEELRDHQDQEHFPCEQCNIVFSTKAQLEQHDAEQHCYCIPCKRFFMNQNNLKAHLNSSIHKPKSVLCPGCTAGFVSLSALILHFETGKCPSGVTRQMVDRLIRQYDRDHLITNPPRMIAGGTPNDSPGVEYRATELAWNPDVNAYECYLCHRLFAQLRDLNAHLASQRHSGPQHAGYHCPQGFGCGKQFHSCGALLQHIEGGSCGVQKFKPMKHAIDDLVGRMRRLTAV